MHSEQTSDPAGRTCRTPREAELDPVVAIGRALSDATRVRLLLELAGGERCVGDLVLRLGLPQATVSYHLGLLRSPGIVVHRRSGERVFYRVAPAHAGPGERATLRPPRHGVEVAVGRSGDRPS